MYKGGFGGFGGGNQMQQLMRQAQKMQAEMEKAQSELEGKEFEGTSTGGYVKVVVSGKKIVKSITIAPEIVDADDVETLEDLIIVALNDAYGKIDEFVGDNKLYGAGF